ncbi:arsenate reductase (glutaredoxin) [Oleiagrimonas sp.]|jgi:arsenate reductase|uniref:arsenate reductase (glutaredoxin) n=1 Tax=Oleiagrimonas sp. TaxID=2010330 RepID=UPI0026058D87|nr:arsenate reductase (glutaredoxin) [Oleiagrimonas sp.]MDA3914227.1 arsenate reductase (glutaredoxin) [Oleiagrimonas sp.]
MNVRILHNPRCSKSRATLALLEERGIKPDVVRYLEQPPSVDELEQLLEMLGLQPRQLMRRNEPVYEQKQLDDPGLDRTALLETMARNPILIQRPIVIHGARAAIGRPPEAILEIL